MVPPLGPFWRKVENGSMFEKKTRENYLLENNCTIRCPDHLGYPEKGPRGGTMGALTTQKKKVFDQLLYGSDTFLKSAKIIFSESESKKN